MATSVFFYLHEVLGIQSRFTPVCGILLIRIVLGRKTSKSSTQIPRIFDMLHFCHAMMPKGLSSMYVFTLSYDAFYLAK